MNQASVVLKFKLKCMSLFKINIITKMKFLYCHANENERICRRANFTLEAKNHYDLHKKTLPFQILQNKDVFS